MNKTDTTNLLCSIFHELEFIGYGSERARMIFEQLFSDNSLGDFDEEYQKWGEQV